MRKWHAAFYLTVSHCLYRVSFSGYSRSRKNHPNVDSFGATRSRERKPQILDDFANLGYYRTCGKFGWVQKGLPANYMRTHGRP